MKRDFDLSISILVFALMYSSLIIGFFLNENSSGGAQKDFLFTFFIIENFSIDPLYGINSLINSDIPHSPLHYLIIGTAYKYISSIESLRFVFLQFYILIPFFFYKCLIEVSIKKSQSLLLSSIIFLSPYFRSSAIWVTTDNTALLFFLISVFFFLKIQNKNNNNNNKNLYTSLSILFLGLSALTRFYYITFILYFIFELIKKNNLKYLIINGILILIIFFPSVSYYFEKKKLLHNFITDNIFDNIYINISIIFFYLIPIVFSSFEKIYNFINFLKSNKKKVLINIIIFSIFFFNFNYYQKNYGGGILYQIIKTYVPLYSFFFYLISIFGIMTIIYVLNNSIKNTILILIFFFNFNYMIIYQKYFDPLLLVNIFIFFSNLTDNFFGKYFIKNFIIIFIYLSIFLGISIIKNS